jgi:glycosidase
MAGDGGGALILDDATGLPSAIEFPPSTNLAPIVCTTSLVLRVGGDEVRALAGGLDYPRAQEVSGFSVAAVGTTAPGTGAGAEAWLVRTALPGWSLLLDYRVGGELPRVRLAFELTRDRAERRPVRNVEVELAFALDPAEWRLHAPGNRVAPGTGLADLGGVGAELPISPATGSLGSLGLVALSHRRFPACLILWPFSNSEIGWVTLVPETGGVRLRIKTNLAGDPAPGEPLRYTGINFDALASGWDEVRGRIRPALRSLGVSSPGPKPDWARSAAIYEVQVGRSVFLDGWSYEPYPRLEDVTADLERIVALGFDTVQLMPCQPYPSYNVHDYNDIDTTYGGEKALAVLVQRAHQLGVRVVLDVVLHGVLDRRSIRDALARVEENGILDAPAPPVGDVFAGTPSAFAALQRAWCQHIVDFGPYWTEGSPEVHPLTIEHPEWFCTDSSGRFTGIYTEAFDLAEESWQDWFCEITVSLVERFGVDGFRFDAPTYNNFANWSRQRRHRASASSAGCVALFKRLRDRLKARFPDVLMFTEPSGVVLRESMDMNYNYDELWLVPALTAGGGATSTVLNGSQLSAWFDERDTTLPADALTCHHLDSHDTFWWPAPGRKWRREQIGLPATRALTWCLALSGGAFMMFTGGEAGMEDDLARTLALRRQRDELREGAADFSAAVFDDEAVFSVLRHRGRAGVLVVVNLSAREVSAECELRGGWRAEGTGTDGGSSVQLGPYALALLDVRR